MRGLLTAVAIAVALGGAGVAQAGTVTLANDVMTFEAGPGEANRIFVIRDVGGMRVVETAVAVTAGGGCTQENASEAFCASEDLTLLEIDVVAGDESAGTAIRICTEAMAPICCAAEPNPTFSPAAAEPTS